MAVKRRTQESLDLLKASIKEQNSLIPDLSSNLADKVKVLAEAILANPSYSKESLERGLTTSYETLCRWRSGGIISPHATTIRDVLDFLRLTWNSWEQYVKDEITIEQLIARSGEQRIVTRRGVDGDSILQDFVTLSLGEQSNLLVKLQEILNRSFLDMLTPVIVEPDPEPLIELNELQLERLQRLFEDSMEFKGMTKTDLIGLGVNPDLIESLITKQPQQFPASEYEKLCPYLCEVELWAGPSKTKPVILSADGKLIPFERLLKVLSGELQ